MSKKIDRPACEICHQHKVNGPNRATKTLIVLNREKPICGSCARKFINNPFARVLPLEVMCDD